MDKCTTRSIFIARISVLRNGTTITQQPTSSLKYTYTRRVYKLKQNEINAKMRKYTKSKWENEIITRKNQKRAKHQMNIHRKQKKSIKRASTPIMGQTNIGAFENIFSVRHSNICSRANCTKVLFG